MTVAGTTHVRVEPLARLVESDPLAALNIVQNATGDGTGGIVSFTASLPQDFVMRLQSIGWQKTGTVVSGCGFIWDLDSTFGGQTMRLVKSGTLIDIGGNCIYSTDDVHTLIRPENLSTFVTYFQTNTNAANYVVYTRLLMWPKDILGKVPHSAFYPLLG